MVIDRNMLTGGVNKSMAKGDKKVDKGDRLTKDVFGTEIPENEGPEDMTEGSRKPFDPKTGDERAGSNSLTNPDWEDVKRARLGDEVVDKLKEARKNA